MISNQTLELLKALPKNWGAAAEELMRIEESGEWKDAAPSFTSYISEIAAKTGKTASTFWRIVSAGREYKLLMLRVDPKARTFPPLERVRNRPSPESLELLGKIERVAPNTIIEQFQTRALEGKITRDELRPVWQTYRPFLNGKTKRGRGVPAPRYLSRNASADSMLEANMFAMLAREASSWLSRMGKVCRIVPPTAQKSKKLRRLSIPDIVILSESRDGAMVMHGVEVFSTKLDVREIPLVQDFDPDHCAVDFVWMAALDHVTEAVLGGLPEVFGVLTGSSGEIQVIREARRISSNETPKERLLRFLLLDLIAHKSTES